MTLINVDEEGGLVIIVWDCLRNALNALENMRVSC